jgi:hypothetical protein
MKKIVIKFDDLYTLFRTKYPDLPEEPWNAESTISGIHTFVETYQGVIERKDIECTMDGGTVFTIEY